jgi:alpha/beta superfamily hydrolase
MNSQTERIAHQGSAGAIEVVVDRPIQSGLPPKGVAFIAHPHPLFGGTMDNKVVQTMARAFVQQGWQAVRFNFRGVGGSAGEHDHGKGEADDMGALVQALAPHGALALAGFSFGAFVASQVANQLWLDRQADLHKLVLVGTAASRFPVPSLPAALHRNTLVLHGEVDDTVPLSSVMDWARPQSLPVTVIPAVGHFFHGQLPLLKGLVQSHLSANEAGAVQ